MTRILILYYSRTGGVKQLARYVARGVRMVDGAEAILRTVPPVSPITEIAAPPVPDEDAPYVSLDDFNQVDGLILGSPTRFGNMAAPLKHFIDQLGGVWFQGKLINVPAGVFTSTSSLHGGQESTLLSMMTPLIHLGCVMVGVPYSEPALMTTQTGGTPYGASHHSGIDSNLPLSRDEETLAIALGKRVTELAKKLK